MTQRKKLTLFLRSTTSYLTTYLFNTPLTVLFNTPLTVLFNTPLTDFFLTPHLQKFFLFTPTLYFRYRKDTGRIQERYKKSEQSANNQRTIPEA